MAQSVTKKRIYGVPIPDIPLPPPPPKRKTFTEGERVFSQEYGLGTVEGGLPSLRDGSSIAWDVRYDIEPHSLYTQFDGDIRPATVEDAIDV